MKKIIILALCLFAFRSTVFAFDMAVGVGGVFGFVNDTWEYNDHGLIFNRTQFGGFAFFGTKYTEFNFTVRRSNNEFERTGTDAYSNESDTTLMLSVGGYGKIPISLGNHFILFPTIGIDFDGVDDAMFLWLRGGLGFDVFFTERFFIRGQALYGYGFSIFNQDENVDKCTPGHCPFFKLGFGWMF